MKESIGNETKERDIMEQENDHIVNQLDWWRQSKEQPKQIIPNLLKIVPSISKPLELELKPSPNHLIYEYLGRKNTLPVFFAAHLDAK
ncbi:hypothetical protein EPI10_005235 [Gossypium australe]|uniref:Uncharacterized protein n=1 Tax=Gossypium australe TaxID=47621 RepID=A0A5B6WQ04_9ROSI|nr:hypothetical protein EPI10_005235 [Gossypium australe]